MTLARAHMLPVVLIAAAASVLPTAAAAPTAPESLVFSTRRSDGAWSIHTIRANGGGDRALTRGAPEGASPAWSSDGQTIAFAVESGATSEIWTVRPDGSDRRRILRTTIPWQGFLELDWSPDGERIAFGDGLGRIRVLTVPTGKVVAIGPRDATSPSFAPDGRRIAFERFGTGARPSVWTMNADGTNALRLADGESPAWSPQGDLIAFTGRVEDEDSFVTSYPLFVMRPDGSGRRAVTNDQHDAKPAWSPDGAQIAMRAFPGPGRQAPFVSGIAVVNRDGRGMRLITNLVGAEQATWSPDGRTIAFGDGTSLYTVAVDGSSRPRPVLSPLEDYTAAWSPDGTSLAVSRYDAARDFSGTALLDRRGRLVRLLDANVYGRLSWSPDGERIVGDADLDSIGVADVATGDSELILEDAGAGSPSKSDPDWSPDGRTIAFVLDSEGPRAELALYDLRTRRTRGLGIAGERPAWSPDGQRLAFVRATRCGRRRCAGVFTYRLGSRRVTLLARNAWDPAWSPNGRRIAFVRETARTNSDVYVMDADGSNQRRVTRTPDLEAAPDWQPSPGSMG